MLKKLLLFGVVLGVIIGSILYSYEDNYKIYITEQQITKQLAKKFPLKKTYLLIMDVTASNPRVVLKNGSSRIQFGIDTKIKTKFDASSLSASIDVLSGIKYKPSTGEFYLNDLKIDSLNIDKAANKDIEKLMVALDTVILKYLENYPIYKLKPTDIKKSAAKMLLRDVSIQDKKIVISLGLN